MRGPNLSWPQSLETVRACLMPDPAAIDMGSPQGPSFPDGAMHMLPRGTF